MSRFRYAEIREQCCDLSTDLEVKAIPGCSVALYHLQIRLSDTGRR